MRLQPPICAVSRSLCVLVVVAMVATPAVATPPVTTSEPAPEAAPQPEPEPMPMPEPVAAPEPEPVPEPDAPLDQPAVRPEPPAINGGAPLSPYERDILARGPISAGAYVAGGLLGTWMGFGVGHAVQGRYDEAGLIFSVGEAAGLGMLMVGIINLTTSSDCFVNESNGGFICETNRSDENLWTGLAISGGVLYGLLRIWEIADLWSGPPRHNAEYKRVRAKTGGWSLSLLPVPLPGGGMAVAGVRF